MAVQTFPSNLIAGMFNFAKRDMFELEDAEQREPVKVSF
jgi:LemA protein